MRLMTMRFSVMLQRHARLDMVAEVRSGRVSGVRRLFPVDASEVAKGDWPVWPSVLSVRCLRSFSVPDASDLRMFYPRVDGHVLYEEQVKNYRWT